MRLSVVIPTKDRLGSLERVLHALERQKADVDGGVEVVVADDGSGDGTRAFLEGEAARGALAFVPLSAGGPARARNAGVDAATGELLVFLGDDVEPQPGFLAAHANAHARAGGPRAVLGYTSWDTRRMRVSPLLEYLNEYGPQFGYALIEDPSDVPFNFFYTSNVSLPRSSFVELGGFDTSFPDAAFEDVEFAYRASRRGGLRMVYEPRARALHDHPTTLSDFRRRLRARGRSAARFASLHPELTDWLGVTEAGRSGGKRPIRLAALEALVRLTDPVGVRLPRGVYHRLLRWDYVAGVSDGLRPSEGTFGAAS